MPWGSDVSFVSSSHASSCDAASCMEFAITPIGEDAVLPDIIRMITGRINKIFLFFIVRFSFLLAVFQDKQHYYLCHKRRGMGISVFEKFGDLSAVGSNYGIYVSFK